MKIELNDNAESVITVACFAVAVVIAIGFIASCEKDTQKAKAEVEIERVRYEAEIVSGSGRRLPE